MIKTNPLSVEKIKSIANEIRNQYDVPIDKPFPILNYIDYLVNNNKLCYQIIEDDVDWLDKNIKAVYNAVENFIYIKESVLKEYENKEYRSAFTLCHELFHYIQTQILNFEFIDVNECKTYEDIDWQANEFAGQLLIPSEYLNLDENIICEMFNVSLECALTRKAKNKKRDRK